jgi:WS/DGAT/MGAT family acyltransferase
MHHAAVDGMSGAEIMSVLLDPTPEGRDCGSAPDRRPERLPSQLEMLARGVAALPRQPVRALGTVPEALLNLQDLPVVGDLPGAGLAGRAARLLRRGGDGEVLERPKARAPRTRFNQRISPHRRVAFGSLSLTEVKAVKAAFGVTVNDVVVALCATALRSWLQRRDELPDECLVAMIPVSVRTEEERRAFGNRVSAMFVPIPTNHDDPRRRLERANEIMRSAKARHQALPATLLQDMTHFIPPAVAARASRVTMQLATTPVVRPLVNVVISNVPGPREPLYCAGAQLCANYPVSVIAEGSGLNITVLSYRDSMDFGIVCDREQMQDPWELMDDLRAALQEYRELTRPPQPSARRSRTKVPSASR